MVPEPWQSDVGPLIVTGPTFGETVTVKLVVLNVPQTDSYPVRVYVVFTVGLTVMDPDPDAPAGLDDHEYPDPPPGVSVME